MYDIINSIPEIEDGEIIAVQHKVDNLGDEVISIIVDKNGSISAVNIRIDYDSIGIANTNLVWETVNYSKKSENRKNVKQEI